MCPRAATKEDGRGGSAATGTSFAVHAPDLPITTCFETYSTFSKLVTLELLSAAPRLAE
jgi:hypothetical protein